MARGLPGWLGSKGDAGLALKPPVAGADGGERLDGEMGQRQLSSHHDDEVQVTERTCAPGTQLIAWLVIRGLIWNVQRPLPGVPTVGVSNNTG